MPALIADKILGWIIKGTIWGVAREDGDVAYIYLKLKNVPEDEVLINMSVDDFLKTFVGKDYETLGWISADVPGVEWWEVTSDLLLDYLSKQ